MNGIVRKIMNVLGYYKLFIVWPFVKFWCDHITFIRPAGGGAVVPLVGGDVWVRGVWNTRLGCGNGTGR